MSDLKSGVQQNDAPLANETGKYGSVTHVSNSLTQLMELVESLFSVSVKDTASIFPLWFGPALEQRALSGIKIVHRRRLVNQKTVLERCDKRCNAALTCAPSPSLFVFRFVKKKCNRKKRQLHPHGIISNSQLHKCWIYCCWIVYRYFENYGTFTR